jgi:hypothetical protein
VPVEMGIQREGRYFCLCFSKRCGAANLPFVDLAVLPAGVSAPRSDAGNAAIRFEGDVGLRDERRGYHVAIAPLAWAASA